MYNFAKDLYNFAKVAKFRQIWIHCGRCCFNVDNKILLLNGTLLTSRLCSNNMFRSLILPPCLFNGKLRWFFNGPFPVSFCLFSVFFKQTLHLLQQIDVKYVHPENNARIRTHNLATRVSSHNH